MEETSLSALARQTRRSPEEILSAAESLGIPVRYSQPGRSFYPDEVRKIYRKLFPGLSHETVPQSELLSMFPGINRKKLEALAGKLGIRDEADGNGEKCYGIEDAQKLASELEGIVSRDLGDSLDPSWWPPVDDYVFLTEVNNCGRIYEMVRGMEHPPIMDELMD